MKSLLQQRMVYPFALVQLGLVLSVLTAYPLVLGTFLSILSMIMLKNPCLVSLGAVTMKDPHAVPQLAVMVIYLLSNTEMTTHAMTPFVMTHPCPLTMTFHGPISKTVTSTTMMTPQSVLRIQSALQSRHWRPKRPYWQTLLLQSPLPLRSSWIRFEILQSVRRQFDQTMLRCLCLSGTFVSRQTPLSTGPKSSRLFAITGGDSSSATFI